MKIMKKNMYIQPDVQVTEMTGMQVMQYVSPTGVIGNGGDTGNMGVANPEGD